MGRLKDQHSDMWYSRGICGYSEGTQEGMANSRRCHGEWAPAVHLGNWGRWERMKRE